MVDLRQEAQEVPEVPEAPEVPEGRYGRARGTVRGAEARTDRRLKITGGVLGVLMLALIAWIGSSYISGQEVSGELIKFKVVSDSAVEVHLEVRKDAGTAGVCTLRTRAESGGEVGRKDAAIAAPKSRVDTVITVRTTSRATSAELVGCQKK
ncbi:MULTISPECIES: DUF4307 domain-containing protein [unclassified Streptomyces]|uniref:DUF4307 domain-containing protein n=1 Tax=unclassified Streptomyces TaxID=2593676 RepID=UPI002DD7AD21|nr:MULTISPECIES: DUF4307 domain-containing protein [unclassified Streptomyces]WSA92725.1 DUF4307 domain-containing protein [Streptomyces sp. NBC_01795]WSB77096.1 DUF4307 domain-containing protein [Streptomyces sp. NBC_01775]WSS14637.1 DUF4307 domain-containing protein [Streptomyces sp. NBC_01186]WSS43451.1 DUF4307 domain-containing protein [Streptomyces sp. NBC_01187]